MIATDNMSLARAYVKLFAVNSPLWPRPIEPTDIDRVANWFNKEMQAPDIAFRNALSEGIYVAFCEIKGHKTFVSLWPGKWETMSKEEQNAWQKSISGCLLDFLDSDHVLGSVHSPLAVLES